MSPSPGDKDPNSWIRDPKDVLEWCASQGVAPMPCYWESKKPVRVVWKGSLEKEAPDCGGFLVDHPARRAAIEKYWKTVQPSKIPFFIGWDYFGPSDYYDDENAEENLFNISLVTGWNDICSIDCDTQEAMDLAETLVDAPKVISKKGGKFVLRLVGEAPRQVQYKTPDGKVGLEFFSKGKHVLIYGMHPDVVPYKFYPKDIPLMTWEEIQAILIRVATQTGLTEKSEKSASRQKIAPDIISKAYAARGSKNISAWFDLPNPVPDNTVPHGDGFQGAHPVHGSTTGNNFSVTGDGRWYCHRHGVGGDRFLWFLIENHIIECEQAGDGWNGLTQQQKHEATELLKSKYPDRYEEYRKLAPKTNRAERAPDANEIFLEHIPDTLPDHKIVLLDGLPRTWKTSFGIDCLLAAERGLYISNTHAIIENSLEKLREKLGSDSQKTVVCVTGKMYACNDERKGRCDGCPKAPKNPTDEEKPGISVLSYVSIAKDLLQEKRILTKDNIPKEYCSYYALLQAAEIADYIFTVPFFSTVDDDARKVKTPAGGLLVIDEDTTLDHYRTPCGKIARYQRAAHGGGQVELSWTEKHELWFSELQEYVKHRLDDENGKPSKRKMPVDTCITDILEKFIRVYNILIEFNHSPTIEGFVKVKEDLKTIDFSNDYDYDFKKDVLGKVEEYSKEAEVDGNAMSELFATALYPGAPTFSWQGDNPIKLFFISDDSLYLLPDFEKLLLICASQGDRFVKDYAAVRNITDISKLTITGFPYAENYLFVCLAGPTEEKLEKMREDNPDVNPAEFQSKQFRRFLREYHKHNMSMVGRYPAIIFTASKEKQTALYNRMQAGSVMISNHKIADIEREGYLTGCLSICTQNSRISRGLDIQGYDRVFFNPGEFATPAITAQIQNLEEQKSEQKSEDPNADVSDLTEEIRKLKIRRAAIQTNEITNCVLRTAPIPSDETSLKRLKIVVMRKIDYDKLDDRIKILTKSMLVYEDEDVGHILTAMDSIHHAVIPTDANPDRPSLIHSPDTPPVAPTPLLSLSEQADRVMRYKDFYVRAIDREGLPYEKVINDIASYSTLSKMNKCGDPNRTTQPALVNYIAYQNPHIPKNIIEDCITCGLSDRLLLSDWEDSKNYVKLHPNVIHYRLGLRITGPDFPEVLKIIHKKL